MVQPERAVPGQTDPIRFAASFVRSDAFRALFRDGMALVEATAAYLDGEGRSESARLSRHVALDYASVSMRLTTRLMQIASWLLVQRAVAEGEITPAQAAREKTRVRLASAEAGPAVDDATLPPRLAELNELSLRLHARILHLEALLVAEPAPVGTAVAAQHAMLSAAFER